MGSLWKASFGEFIGTFILVFVGCGTVALAVLFNAFHNLFEIALIWGLGIAAGIYAVKSFSKAHFNPAVTLAFLILRDTAPREALAFVLFQFAGAMTAGWILFFLFQTDIAAYEQSHQLTRGEAGSHASAMMFGEFYPNPGNPLLKVTMMHAFLLEGAGTFVLVVAIFFIVNRAEKHRSVEKITPLLIGFTVTGLICAIAPYTQAGFNPARDLGPRFISSLNGWGTIVFQENGGSVIVYVLGPLVGAVVGALGNLMLRRFHQPVHVAN